MDSGACWSVSTRCHQGLGDDESTEEVLARPLRWVPDPTVGAWLQREKADSLCQQVIETGLGLFHHEQ